MSAELVSYNAFVEKAAAELHRALTPKG